MNHLNNTQINNTQLEWGWEKPTAKDFLLADHKVSWADVVAGKVKNVSIKSDWKNSDLDRQIPINPRLPQNIKFTTVTRFCRKTAPKAYVDYYWYKLTESDFKDVVSISCNKLHSYDCYEMILKDTTKIIAKKFEKAMWCLHIDIDETITNLHYWSYCEIEKFYMEGKRSI